jgi:15-cis-phytoene synthase
MSRALAETSTILDGQAAEATLKYHGRSFHLASRLLPSRTRDDAARLYAFCRYVDDLADEGEDPILASDRLRALREDLVHGQARSIQSASFLALSTRLALPLSPALHLIDTVAAEVQGIRVAEASDLLDYAYGVAGTVGLMMCAVLGARMPAGGRFAVDLGIAMQLTNIARDVGEDAAIGRVYLPGSWLDGLSPVQILSPDQAQRQQIRQATAKCLRLADHYYESGLAGLQYLPARSRMAIRVAADVYRAIGTRIEASGYRSWDRRAVVPVPTRLSIAAVSLLRQLIGSVPPIQAQASASPASAAQATSSHEPTACKPPRNTIS